MKKKRMMSLTLGLALSLTPGTAFAGEITADYPLQLTGFVNQVSVWKPKAKASYAYTDLDQDGNLEILTSYTSKKGEVSNALFEMREGRITQVELPWGEDDPQPELKEQSIPVYLDEEEGTYYFVFGSTGEAPCAIALKDDALVYEALTQTPEERFEGFAKREGSIGWISTAEHSLKDAPLEQLGELGGISISMFKILETEDK